MDLHENGALKRELAWTHNKNSDVTLTASIVDFFTQDNDYTIEVQEHEGNTNNSIAGSSTTYWWGMMID